MEIHMKNKVGEFVLICGTLIEPYTRLVSKDTAVKGDNTAEHNRKSRDQLTHSHLIKTEIPWSLEE